MSVEGKTFQTSSFFPVDTVDCSVRCLHIFQSSIILLCILQIGLLFPVPEDCTKSEMSALLNIFCAIALHRVSYSCLEP